MAKVVPSENSLLPCKFMAFNLGIVSYLPIAQVVVLSVLFFNSD